MADSRTKADKLRARYHDPASAPAEKAAAKRALLSMNEPLTAPKPKPDPVIRVAPPVFDARDIHVVFNGPPLGDAKLDEFFRDRRPHKPRVVPDPFGGG